MEYKHLGEGLFNCLSDWCFDTAMKQQKLIIRICLHFQEDQLQDQLDVKVFEENSIYP